MQPVVVPILAKWSPWRRLLLKHPMLWRLQLPWAVGISVLAWIVCLLAGGLLPAAPQTLWTQGQISALEIGLLIALAIAGGMWARLQLRYARIEQPVRIQWIEFIANLVVLLSIVWALNGYSWLVAARVSSAMPRADIDEMYEFHKAHDFWRCDQVEAFRSRTIRAGEPPTAEHTARITADAARFGLNLPNFVVGSDGMCFRSRIMFLSANEGPRMLETFVSRLGASQVQHRVASRTWWGAHAPSAATTMTLPAIGAIALWIFSMPPAQAVRLGLRLPNIRARGRRAFRQYERNLLLKNPWGWALDAHRIGLRQLIFCAIASAITYVLSAAFTAVGPALILTIMGGGIFWHVIAIFRRFASFPLPIASWAWPARIGISMLVIVPGWVFFMVIVLAAEEKSPGAAELFFSAYFVVGIIWLTTISATILANAFKLHVGLLFWLLGAASMFFALSMQGDQPWLIGIWLVWLVLISILAFRGGWRDPGRFAVMAAVATVTTLPALFASCQTLIYSMDYSSVVAIVLMGCVIAVGGIALAGPCRILARRRLAPHRR